MNILTVARMAESPAKNSPDLVFTTLLRDIAFARVWNLPKVICLAVKNHHSVDRALDDHSIENPTLKTLLCVLKMAEDMVNLPERLAQCDVDFEWQKVGAKVLEFSGLSEYDYEDLRDAVRYTLGDEICQNCR
ncbi:MAG: hypothetical protein Q9M92_08525 [Enterobacterales bacterium]|nr:hypothetical protein [Enterobacterales bacterium]